MKYLIVVDVQKDFVGGDLGSKEAAEMLSSLIQKVKSFDGEVIFTKDTHFENYLETQEGRLLPVKHCIKNTDGWEFPTELAPLAEGRKVYEKSAFASRQLAEDMLKSYECGKVDSVELVGICTDICVVSNALMLKGFMPELTISVDASCCAGVTPQKHNAALDTMESCQVIVTNR